MTKLQSLVRITLTTVAFAFAEIVSPPVSAAPITLTPAGLHPGDTYHLVFVTSIGRDATSTNITDYDSFVQGVANAAGIGSGSPSGNIEWRVIGSTSSIDAISHIGVQGSVFRLDGIRIASGSLDLWDGLIEAPIIINENGVVGHVDPMTGPDSTVGPRVMVGTTLAGLRSLRHELGSDQGVAVARLFSVIGPGECVFWGETPSNVSVNSYYAISQALTVIPEPGGLGLVAIGILALLISTKITSW